MQTLYYGKIKTVSGSFGSGIASLTVGTRVFHADNGPLMRALDAAFGGIGPGHTFNPRAVAGKAVYVYMDDMGLCMGGFVPADSETRARVRAAVKAGEVEVVNV